MSLQALTILALIAFGIACVIAFVRGARLPESAFDDEDMPPENKHIH